jgi:hypothetical protein
MKFNIGDRVKHIDAGWTGVITQVFRFDGNSGSPLVSVAPITPRPYGAPPDWPGWNPFVLPSDELKKVAV